jgi:hypothetical protein
MLALKWSNENRNASKWMDVLLIIQKMNEEKEMLAAAAHEKTTKTPDNFLSR